MKKNFYVFAALIFSLLFVLSCGQQKSADSTKLMDQLLQTMNSHDAAATALLYAEDATYMLAGEPEPLRGRNAIEEYYAGFFTGFPDIEVEVTLVMASGENIMVEGVIRGTHTGPFPTPEGDIPATGRKMELGFAGVLKVKPDGLIADDRTYFDSAVMMSQLGLNEPTSETSAK